MASNKSVSEALEECVGLSQEMVDCTAQHHEALVALAGLPAEADRLEAVERVDLTRRSLAKASRDMGAAEYRLSHVLKDNAFYLP